MSASNERPLQTEWMSFDRLLNHVQPGDLIEIRRFGDFDYAHWAIYNGRDQEVPEVVHFATAWGDFGPRMDSLNAASDQSNVLNGLIANPMAHIRIDPLESVAGGAQVRINHDLDRKHPPFPADVVLERALSKLNSRDYNLVSNNCEHFVNWCRYDQPVSLQVHKFVNSVTGLFNHLRAPAVDGQNENNKEKKPKDADQPDIPLD